MGHPGSGVFEARLGGVVRWITLGTCLLLIAVMVVGVVMARHDPLQLWTTIPVPALVLAAGWAWRPTGYVVEGDGIHVLRPIGRKRIAARGAQALLDDEAFKGAWRPFGNGGLVAFSGWWRSRKYGGFRAWATDLSSLVVLRSEGRVVVISPEEPRRFIDALGGMRA